MKSVHHEVRLQAYNQIWDLVNNKQVWIQVRDQLRDQVYTRVCDQVYCHVWIQLQD